MNIMYISPFAYVVMMKSSRGKYQYHMFVGCDYTEFAHIKTLIIQ